jgi:regulator of replication initiation timing
VALDVVEQQASHIESLSTALRDATETNAVLRSANDKLHQELDALVTRREVTCQRREEAISSLNDNIAAVQVSS